MHVKFTDMNNLTDLNESIQVTKTSQTWECLEDCDLQNKQSSFKVFKG